MDRPVRELNLELGRPDAAEALRRLAAEVEAARAELPRTAFDRAMLKTLTAASLVAPEGDNPVTMGPSTRTVMVAW